MLGSQKTLLTDLGKDFISKTPETEAFISAFIAEIDN